MSHTCYQCGGPAPPWDESVEERYVNAGDGHDPYPVLVCPDCARGDGK